jgi:hypothetical protein
MTGAGERELLHRNQSVLDAVPGPLGLCPLLTRGVAKRMINGGPALSAMHQHFPAFRDGSF